jgi:hypothetical protein
MTVIQSFVRAGLLACSLAATQAAAQTASPDQAGPPPASTAGPTDAPADAPAEAPIGQQQPNPRPQRFIERFQAANMTGDGRLTLAQAEAAHLQMIVRNFDTIDAQHKGYVTLQDIQAYRQQMHATRTNRNRTTN